MKVGCEMRTSRMAFYRLSHNLLNLLEGIASGNLNSGLVIYAVPCRLLTGQFLLGDVLPSRIKRGAS